MKLHRFEVSAFGRLAGFKANDLSEHELIVLHGRNEAGKSTFLEFVTTMLYGFGPADRHKHPYAPWSGAAMEGTADFRLADGNWISVHRRLAEAPKSRFWRNETESDIGNGPVPVLGPISRQLYRRFHALSIETLEDLDDEAWKALEERLLGGSHLEYLRAVREAVICLHLRADELWQAHPRGATHHRRVALTVRRLLRERDAAVARSARLAEVRDLIAGRTWHIETTETQLLDMRTRLDRAETLLPVLRGVQAMDDLRRRADERVREDDLPADARARLDGLTQTAVARERDASNASEQVAEMQRHATMAPADLALLGVEGELRALLGEAPVHQQDLVTVNDLQRERIAREAEFVERSQNTFREAPDDAAREALASLPFADLQARLKTWEEQRRLPAQADEEVARAEEAAHAAQEDLEVLPTPDGEKKLRRREEALRQLQAREDLLAALQADIKAAKAQAAAGAAQVLKSKIPGGAKAKAVGLLVAAAALVATIAFGLSTAWWLLGPVALGLAAAGVLTLKNTKVEAPRAPDEVRADALARDCLKQRAELELHEYETFVGHLERAQQALAMVAQRPELERRLMATRERLDETRKEAEVCRKQAEQALAAVADVVSALPMRPDRMTDPRQDLLNELTELRAGLRELARLDAEREAVAQRADEREARALALGERLELTWDGQAMDAVPHWHERLQRALVLRRRADEAEAALPTVREKLAECERRLAVARDELAAFERRLVALDPQGRDVEAGLRALSQARAWRAEADDVERQLHARFPDWAERAEEARMAAAAGEPLDLDTEQRNKLVQQIQQLDAGLLRMRTERDALRGERDRLASRRTLGDIDGALAALQEEGERMARRRDRLVLVANVLREGDARWRERCQPPVLRSASEYLCGITGGAWDRLHAEPHDEGTRLFVSMQPSGRQVEVGAPLSRALRRQIHLALRLAIAEQLDQAEPLPLVLDDVLIDWDSSRSTRGVEVLAGIAARRQVVLVTGNSELAETLRGRPGTHVMELPPPSEPPTPSVTPSRNASTPAHVSNPVASPNDASTDGSTPEHEAYPA